MSMSQCEKGATITWAITSHHTHTHTLHVAKLFCESPRKKPLLFLSVGVILCGDKNEYLSNSHNNSYNLHSTVTYSLY